MKEGMMKLGDGVLCAAYIKPAGNYYIILSEKEHGTAACEYWAKGASEGVEVEDFHNCDRYRVIDKMFHGIYVGTTTICTRLNAECWDDGYQSGFRTYCDEPKKFAVVYYADNKKRIVPIDKTGTMW